MGADRIEPKSWARSTWFTWSWLLVLAFVVVQTLTVQCRILPTTGSGYFARGRADYLDGEYAKAITSFSQSIDKDPKDAEGYIWRGESYRMLHEFDKAKPDLLKALELAPNYAKSHAGLGDYLAATWDRDGAIKEFTAAIERDSSYGRAYFERGQLHFDAGRWDDAAADLRKASTLLDEDQQGLAQAFLWLSRVRGGDAAGAAAELADAAKTHAVTVHWFPAAVAFLTGDKPEPDFFKEIGRDTESDADDTLRVEAYFLAGEKRLALGDRAGALGLLREVIRSGDDEAYAHDRARVELQKSFLGFEPARHDDGSLTIVSVIPGGAAEAAGIKPGSTLAAIDGEAANPDVFLELLAKLNPGLTAELKVVGADGVERVVPLEVPVTLETSAPTK